VRRLVLVFAACRLIAAAPEVSKVEPPNWWVGHSLNPVRLLIYGKDLKGATVKCAEAAVKLGQVQASAAGTYLFVEIQIQEDAKPGAYSLQITTPDGTATAPFELLAPLPRHGRFQGFSPDDVIYLAMPDRFANGDPSNDDPLVSRGLFDRRKARYYHGGDFQGIINHLPYLKELGVTALWLTPVYDNVNHLNEREKYEGEAITDYHGYGAVDFYGVEEHFGDLALLKKLVDAAHTLGLKVIQDQVANHTGPYHPWAADPPTPTWFNGTVENHLANTWQIWTLADPRAPASLQKSTIEGWFLNILPDLNQNDPLTAQYLIQNTLWWIASTGIDGIRQDTLPYVPRTFWHDWMRAIKREYPDFRVVGEMWDEDPALVAFFQGGRAKFDGVDSGVDALFDFPLFGAIRRVFAHNAAAEELAKVLAHDRLYTKPNLLVTFLGLHDTARFMNEKAVRVDDLKLAFTFLITTRGIPMIYYGDEIGMTGGTDPDNRRDFPGGWPEDARNAFDSAGRTPEQQAIFEHVQKLMRLRRKLEPLRRGSTLDLIADKQVYAFARVSGNVAPLVIFNLAADPATVVVETSELPIPPRIVVGNQVGNSQSARSWHDELGIAPDAQWQDGKFMVQMPARSAAIYSVGR